MRKTLIALCLATVAAAAGIAPSQATNLLEANENQARPNSFLNRKAEGWFWYIDPKKVEEPEPEEVIPPPVQPAPNPTPAPVSVAPVKKFPEPFSAKWVRETLEDYKDKAWTNPTEENVKAYFLLQRFAVDRSNKFADVAQRVTVGNKLLDENFRRPIATFGSQLTDKETITRRYDMLKHVAEKAGIFFFFKSDCQYCEAEAPIVSFMEHDFGFKVIAISLDGGELQSAKFKDMRRNAGHAEQLGVTATPALFLVDEEGHFDAIGQGALAWDDLQRRVLLVAQRAGWITEDEYKQTTPIANPELQTDLSEKLPQLIQASNENPTQLWGTEEEIKSLEKLASSEKAKFIDQNNYIKPKDFLALLDGAKTNGQMKDISE